jgi:Flp pilus assembly protein TadD
MRKSEDMNLSRAHWNINLIAQGRALFTLRGALLPLLFSLGLALSPATLHALTQKKKPARGKSSASQTNKLSPTKTLTIRTEPKAAVWLDELRRGSTDSAGQLVIQNVSASRHTLRVRATGFSERTLAVLPTQRGTLDVRLTPTTDEAELLFQQAEDAREGVVGADGVRKDAAELYRRALELRPRFPAAHVGLARVLLSREDHDSALEQIDEARRDRPNYAEASAVEGRILRSAADTNAAVESYQRAIREARGFQPEAYAGLGIVQEEKGDYEGAVASFRKAIAQLQDTEPALYQLLGAAYEKLERYKEAVAAYDKYLQLAPEGKLAPALRSIIDQLRQQAAEQQE